MPGQELLVDPDPADGAMVAWLGVQRLLLGGEGVEQHGPPTYSSDRLTGECRGVVAGELPDVGRRPSGDLGDHRRNRCRLAAPVVRVVLEEALDLPGRQDPAQA